MATHHPQSHLEYCLPPLLLIRTHRSSQGHGVTGSKSHRGRYHWDKKITFPPCRARCHHTLSHSNDSRRLYSAVTVGTGLRSPGLLQCQCQAYHSLGTSQGTNAAPLSPLLFLRGGWGIESTLHSLLSDPAASSVRMGGNADPQILCLLNIKDPNILPPKELQMTLCAKISSPFV